MKIRIVDSPKGITHFHNRKVYDLEGRRYLLTISNKEFKLLPNNVVTRLTSRWSDVCEVDRNGNGHVECYLSDRNRWRLLAELVGSENFSFQKFVLYVDLSVKQDKKWVGEDAFELISLIFSGCIDGSIWSFNSTGDYGVELTTSRMVTVTVPSDQFAALLGDVQFKSDQILNLFRRSIDMDITITHHST